MRIVDITKSNKNETIDFGNRSYLTTSSQKSIRLKIEGKNTFVLIPDFLEYSRMISSNRHIELIKKFKHNSSLLKVLSNNLKNLGALAFTSGIFWQVVFEMSLIDLSSIRKGENLVVHPYIVDLAFHSGKQKFVKKIISALKNGSNGKIGIWSTNINSVLSRTSLKDLDIDFIITPFNDFGVGMRIEKELLSEIIKKENIFLIRDYVTHFRNFSKDIEFKGNSLTIIKRDLKIPQAIYSQPTKFFG